MDPCDTIVALATSKGGAARGILRLSGPHAWGLIGPVFRPALPARETLAAPRSLLGQLDLDPLPAPVPAILYLSRSPRSYTGDDLIEVHTIGSPPLLELAQSVLTARGARQAVPGEFTLRAFLAGKLDLTAAEAVLGLINAADSSQAQLALRQMAGGVYRPIQRLRDQLLDLLAELEAGLDFAEEDLELGGRHVLRGALESAAVQVRHLESQMRGRSLTADRLRVVLVGRPNAGKSTLFNALLGHNAAIVSPIAGTTRDYLVGRLALKDATVDLVDTAGLADPADAIELLALEQQQAQAQSADLLLWCVEGREREGLEGVHRPQENADNVMLVHTKIDLECEQAGQSTEKLVARDNNGPGPAVRCPSGSAYRVSAHTGDGMDGLLAGINSWMHGAAVPELGVVANTAVRCRQSIANALRALDQAMLLVNDPALDDLLAAELRIALDELGQVVGAVYTDDILDRIFSRFCIGK